MSSNMSRRQWCGKDFDPQNAIEAYRPEGERYGSVCSDQCLAQAGCISKEKKDRQEKEAAMRRSSEESRQLLQQERYDEAIAAAEKLAALDGKSVEARVIKGIAFAKKGTYELAIPQLEEALELEANHNEATTTLAALFTDGKLLGWLQRRTLFQPALQEGNGVFPHLLPRVRDGDPKWEQSVHVFVPCAHSAFSRGNR
jgi:tetratricopeptide (TPR) repeat protein